LSTSGGFRHFGKFVTLSFEKNLFSRFLTKLGMTVKKEKKGREIKGVDFSESTV
jgi:hypothetical protein